MAILRLKDKLGNVTEILALRGPAGPTGPIGPAGPRGDDYVLTEEDIQKIAKLLKTELATETWTFTYEDGTVETREMYVL